MNAKSLEERIGILEDIHAISNLKARYLNGADGGWDRLSHDSDVVTPMFVEDGSWHGESFDPAHGWENIRKSFDGFRQNLPFAYHVITNPIIEVNGDEADAEWHVTWMGTDAAGAELWAAGIYTDKLVRTAEGWKFKTIFCRMAFFGPRENGWAKSMGTTVGYFGASEGAQRISSSPS
jgi:hypothetical protein